MYIWKNRFFYGAEVIQNCFAALVSVDNAVMREA
jgi:hypothetical protein